MNLESEFVFLTEGDTLPLAAPGKEGRAGLPVAGKELNSERFMKVNCTMWT